MKSLGMHYLAEFHQCPYEIINNTGFVEDIMNSAAEKSRVTIIKSLFHKFSPHGVSGIIVVAESHFAIHTWPEYGYASVDLFSCGDIEELFNTNPNFSDGVSAASAYFLENLAFDNEISETIKSFLGPKSLLYFNTLYD